jgi:hypothetical protein
MKKIAVLAGVVLTLAMATTSAEAQGRRDYGRDGKWERLGCEEVGRRPDWDVISVGRREGRFSAIRLEAQGNSISILDLKVVYGNGAPDDISVRTEINEGDSTRPLDLRGRDRSIDRIEIVSKKDFRGPGRGRARVCVFGLVADDDRRGDDRYGGGRGDDRGGRGDDRGGRGDDRGGRGDDRYGGGGGGRGGDWEELGCQSVGLLGDRDVIRVGRREGRFKAIKLRVSGNDVHIIDLKVVYGNGAPDDISVRSDIRQGGETRPLDLRGYERSIDRIELIYRAKPNFRGRAKVCALGLQN